MTRYWLGLGSNLGDRAEALQAAIVALQGEGIVVDAVSPVYETAPQDLENQPPFLNAAVRASTDLAPTAVLAAVKRVELAAGRDLTGGVRYGPRPIDIDLLVWDGGVYASRDPDLTIPHARLADRRFALVPLVDVEPHLILPGGASVQSLSDAIDPASQPVARTPYMLVSPA